MLQSTFANQPSTPSTTVAAPLMSSQPVVDENAKRYALEQLSQKTGMNLKFTHECLEKNGYDLEKAYVDFVKLHGQGIIPAEAFQK